MASRAHCFYCFECLSSSFERRDPPTLERVIDLYEQYNKPSASSEAVDGDHGQGNEAHLDDSDSEEGDREGEEEIDQDGDEDEDQERDPVAASSNASRPQLPSISRLQASMPSSRSSNSSTPSILSANSSNTQLTPSSSTSTISSRPTYASRLSVNESYPMFVTWNTVSRSGHKSLRGCIGTFDALPLSSGLASYALTSAFDDTRFSPMPSSLLSALSCSLTLLANFEPCQSALDWTLGRHGLRISFTYRGRRHGATYLPDVAVEQGWDKEETVESLMRKAGWDGGSGHGMARRILRASSRNAEDAAAKPWDEVGDFKAVRYTGLKASAAYAEWREWRAWVDEAGQELR